MTIGILLTSYNRPALLRRTLASIAAQTHDDWRCVVVDDDSDEETQRIIRQRAAVDGRFWPVFTLFVTPEQRVASARYSVHINAHHGWLDGCDVVVHTCDNVEYSEDCFAHVAKFFAAMPDARAGYVLHRRDEWRDGQSVGPLPGHPELIPPQPGKPVTAPKYKLDHSQVFFRWPVALKWPEAPEYRTTGDGVVFEQFVADHGPILPIPPYHKALSLEHYDNLH